MLGWPGVAVRTAERHEAMRVPLAPGQVWVVPPRHSMLRLRAEGTALWVTQPGEPDWIVAAGQEIQLVPVRGKTLVQAFAPGAAVVRKR